MTNWLVKNWLLSWRGVLDWLWLFFLFFLLRHFWLERRFFKRAQSWLLIKGQITQLEWIQEAHRVWPKIEYTYQLFDKEWVGEHFFLDSTLNTPNSRDARQVAYRVAMAFKNDEEIDIYCNPDNPREAVLDITIPPKLNVIIGLLVALIALHLIAIGYHLYKLT